jgi:BTB/POZ domain
LLGNKVNRPRSVVAFHKGVMKELMEISAGQWGPVRWFISDTDKLGFQYKSPNFQLILEFDPPKAEGEVLTRVFELPDNRSVADVEFLVKGQVFDAHSVIVTSATPVMAQMLKDTSCKENPVSLIVIEDVEPNVFREVLRYMYTGVAPDFKEMAEPLLKAAHKFQMESLKNECENVLVSALNFENVVASLQLAHEQSAAKLLESSLQCLEKHKDGVWNRSDWKELSKQNPDLFYLACRRMVTCNKCDKCGNVAHCKFTEIF